MYVDVFNNLSISGPLKKMYGLHKTDPTVPVPKRTLMREYSSSRLQNELACCSSFQTEEQISACTGESSESETDLFEDDSVSNGFGESNFVDGDRIKSLSSEITDDSSENNFGITSVKERTEYNDYNLLSDLSDQNQSFGENESSDSEYFSSSSSAQTSTSTSADELEENFQNYSEKESQMFCISSYLQRHSLSGEAARDLEKLLAALDLKGDSEKLRLTIEEPDYNIFHYCTVCDALFPKDPNIYICQTNGCNSYRYKGGLTLQTKNNRQPNASFILSNVETQLRQILEKPGIWESIQKIKTETSAQNCGRVITDITEGEAYKSLCETGKFLSESNHISAIFNTDGIPLYDSSKVKLWPIYLAINELPVAARFSRENLVLAGMWQGKVKPPFLQYMWAFGEEMCRLHDSGFIIQSGLTSTTVKLCVICGTVDLQAKAYILNMTMFNGAFGCATCEEEGTVVRHGNGHARCYPYTIAENRPGFRNSDNLKYVKGPMATPQQRIKGVCGISGLSVMPWFDLVEGIVPDYMHGVLMGVTKTLLSFWFAPSNVGKQYFMGTHIGAISERLQNISPPDYVERLPRDIEKHYANFKATELQTWLLFYALPCMKGFLPEKYFAHLCLFSEGIYLLLGDRIERDDLDRAEMLLEKFYEQFSDLYNKGSCGLNVHNVGVHLVQFVRLWGPLWAWSCFVFEDANADLLQNVHGTGDVSKQCIRNKEHHLQLRSVDVKRVPSRRMKLFLKSMRKVTRPWSRTEKMCNCLVAGRQNKLGQGTDEELMTAVGVSSLSDIRKVLRVEVDGEKFYCQDYSRMKRRVCYVVMCNNRNLLKIKTFILNCLSKVVYALADVLHINENCFLNAESGKHIIRVSESNERAVIPVENLKEKLFFIEVENNKFISRMPNMFGHCVFK